MRQKKKQDGALAFAVATLVLVLPAAAWYGFVISKLWRWFLVPLGVVPVGVWAAAGICLLVRLATFDATLPRDEDKSPAEKFAAALGLAIIVPAAGLAFGAIYHAFA